MLGGKISPPSGIFLMKNWLSYKDTISLEETIGTEEKTIMSRTPEQIAAEYGCTYLEAVSYTHLRSTAHRLLDT